MAGAVVVENENRCAKCGKGNPPEMRFCGFCGSPLAAAYASNGTTDTEAASPPATSPANGEDLDRTQDVRKALAAATAAAVTPPPVAAPALARPKTTTPPPVIPADPAARDVERDRLMTQVNVFRARGQVTDAREILEKALLYAETSPPRERAPMLEELGDLLMLEEQFEAAAEKFQEAGAMDSSRTALVERKYANARIALSDKEAEKRMGQAVLRDDSIGDILASDGLSGRSGRRNAGLAMTLSVVVPGFGQFYNGQFIKGAVLLGTFALSLLIISLSPDKENLFGNLAALFALKQGKIAGPSPMIIAIAVVGFAAWLYSLVDAPFYANQTTDTDKPLSVVDKSGWEP